MASEKLQVILELVTGQYKKEAKEAATATGQIGSSATAVTGSIGRMIGPAAIGGALVGLTHLAMKAGENADRLYDLAAQTGLSTDALQEWEFVAKTAGAGTEVFADAVKAVIRNLSEVANGTGPAAKAYGTLGVSILDASGNMRDAGAITDEVFEKLAGMENITARNALAQDIFGKKWEETISILDLGTDALGNLREEGKKVVVSPEALKNADKFRETMEKLKATLGAKLNEAIGAIAPLLTDVAEAASDVMEDLQPMLDGLKWLSDRWGDLKDKGEDMAASNNIVEAGWGRMIGELGILNFLTGNYASVIEAGITPTEDLATAVDEVHDSWANVPGAVRESIDVHGEFLEAGNLAAAKALEMRDANREAARSFRVDLTNAIRGFVTFFDGAVDEIETSLETLEAQFTARNEQNERFWNGIAVLARAGLDDLVAELRTQGPAAAGVVEDLVANMAEAFDWERRIEESGRQAAAQAQAIANGLNGEMTTVGAAFNAFGISLARQLEAGFSTADLGNTLTQLMDLASPSGVTTPGRPTRQQFAGGGVVQGPWGSPQLVVAHAGETILPTHQGGRTGGSTTINVYSPTNDLRQDLQYATILASVTNLVEGF